MAKYKIIIEYDGSKYKGWQRLKNSDKTIQEKIEILFSKIIGEDIEIHGAGRTDSGVHAYGQVAHFETKEEIDLSTFINISNQMLPQDIVIKDIQKVDDSFHARFSAKGKKYLYKIWNDEIPTALKRKYTYHVPKKLNIEEMEKAINYLIGEHDFTSFTANRSKNKSMIRKIYDIQIRKIDNEIEISYYGEGFLHKMVRIITGTLIEVGLGEKKPEDVQEILANKRRKYAGKTAPSNGLYLKEVIY